MQDHSLGPIGLLYFGFGRNQFGTQMTALDRAQLATQKAGGNGRMPGDVLDRIGGSARRGNTVSRLWNEGDFLPKTRSVVLANSSQAKCGFGGFKDAARFTYRVQCGVSRCVRNM